MGVGALPGLVARAREVPRVRALGRLVEWRSHVHLAPALVHQRHVEGRAGAVRRWVRRVGVGPRPEMPHALGPCCRVEVRLVALELAIGPLDHEGEGRGTAAEVEHGSGPAIELRELRACRLSLPGGYVASYQMVSRHAQIDVEHGGPADRRGTRSSVRRLAMGVVCGAVLWACGEPSGGLATAPDADATGGSFPVGCSSCHGSSDSPAPPRDLEGQSDPTRRGVGAHRAHLRASHRLSKPVACASCVPPDRVAPWQSRR